ncbi:MAG: V-type ATPase subunit [Clostridiaceae bacterium]|nr:V-type ATPase subunit [Clostridiaceae bacterium]
MSLENTDKRTAVDPDNYGYATGRIRALEASLLSPSDMSRVFEARQPEDISRVIQDKGYASGDIEDALRARHSETYEIMQQIIPDTDFIEALLLFNDCHNLKVVIKYLSAWWTENSSENENSAALPESDPSLAWHGLENMLRTPSLVEPSKLFRAVRDRKPEMIPDWLYELAGKGAEVWLKTYDTGNVDMIIDRGAWERASSIAGSLGNSFFIGYMALRQKLLGLEILLRCRALRTGKEYLAKAIPPVPTDIREKLLEAYDLESDKITSIIDELGLNRSFSEPEQTKILQEYGEPGTAAAYNRIADEVLADWLKKASNVLRGPEVPVAYLLRRELEIKNIRIALTCLRNGVPPAQARELARLAI